MKFEIFYKELSKSIHGILNSFYAKKNEKDMQIFVVVVIWNCYNVGMKKEANFVNL